VLEVIAEPVAVQALFDDSPREIGEELFLSLADVRAITRFDLFRCPAAVPVHGILSTFLSPKRRRDKMGANYNR
jgi:hypothetical protein